MLSHEKHLIQSMQDLSGLLDKIPRTKPEDIILIDDADILSQEIATQSDILQRKLHFLLPSRPAESPFNSAGGSGGGGGGSGKPRAWTCPKCGQPLDVEIKIT